MTVPHNILGDLYAGGFRVSHTCGLRERGTGRGRVTLPCRGTSLHLCRRTSARSSHCSTNCCGQQK